MNQPSQHIDNIGAKHAEARAVTSSLSSKPTLPISEKLALDLGIQPERRSFDSWFFRVISKSSITQHDSPYWAKEIFTTETAPQAADELVHAITALSPQLQNVEAEFKRYFAGVSGHSTRVEELDDFGPRPLEQSDRREEKLHNIIETFFNDYRLNDVGFGSDRHEFVRYDPVRMLQGLGWLERFCIFHAPEVPYLRLCLAAVKEFRESNAYKEIEKIVYAASDSICEESFRDNFGSMARDAIKYGHGDWPTTEQFVCEGYLRFPAEKQDDGTPLDPERPSYRISKITEEYPEVVEAIKAALNRFEYLFTWIKAVKTFEGELCLPDLMPGSDGLKFMHLKSAALVAGEESVSSVVVGNSLILHPTESALGLFGANGCGKTQLLLAVAHATVASSRGTPVFSQAAHVSEVAAIHLGVNLSEHSNTESAFQHEVRELVQILNNIKKNEEANKQILVILDEPFRGTDARDAAPLLAGLIKYLQDHNVMVAFTSHFNVLAYKRAELQSQGVRLQSMTMSQGFEITPGVIGSGGIDVAEEAGLLRSIVEDARSIALQKNKTTISLERSANEKQPAKGILKVEAAPWLEELELLKVTQDWRSQVENLGDALSVLAAFSPYRNVLWDQADNDQWEGARIHEDYAGRFLTRFFERGADRSQRQTDKQIIEVLVSHHESVCAPLVTALTSLRDFRTLTCLDTKEIKPTDVDARRVYEKFASVARTYATNDTVFLEGLQVLSGVCNDFQNHYPILSVEQRELLESTKAVPLMRDFLAKEPQFLMQITHNRPARVDFDLLNRWIAVCHEHRDELVEIDEMLSTLNFYGTIAHTIHSQSWTKVTVQDTPGAISATNCCNTLLASGLGKSKVTNNDVFIDPDISTYILSGTNGGGKTQFMQMVATVALFGERLNYVPGDTASLGRIPYMDVSFHSGTHTNRQSSFQDEVMRIQAMLDRFEAAGSPQGSLLFLDEPFKGTSEEDAIPLILGLMRHSEARGVKLVFTTHFSGIYDYLNRFDEETKLSWTPLAVDYFSETERYKVKQGVGASSGIEIAAKNGMLEEVIEEAKRLKDILFPPKE